MSTYQAPRRIFNLSDGAAASTSHLLGVTSARKLLLVCDELTWKAAGEALHATLNDSFKVQPLILDKNIRATQDALDQVCEKAKSAELIIAVGSGTINDICKAASTRSRLPYVAYPTAASMNGYCSASATITHEGVKDSVSAAPPVAVIIDMQIIATAPHRLTRAGIGDTLCRTVIEADMLLSHHLLGTPYPKELFDQLRRHEPVLMGGTISARGNEEHYLTTLMEALLDAGDAMREFGSSAVASQSEHMIAHTLEMRYGSEMHNILHGELIAITSLTSSQLQHRLLLGTPMVKAMHYDISQFDRLFGKQHAPTLIERYRKKSLTAEQSIEINKNLTKKWPEIKKQLSEIMLPTTALERAFIHSGLSTQPNQIGIAEERYRFAADYAHLTRDRFTFLDLAVMNVKRVF